MVDCKRFHDEYSSFRDGLLPLWEQVAFGAHAEECAACGRFDRVVREGAELVRTLPKLEVSEDFSARLQHRIWHEELDRLAHRRRMRSLRLAGGVGIAAAAAGVVLGGTLRVRGGADALPPVTVEAPGLGGYVVDVPHVEAGRISSELARLGVRLYELPYHDIVYRHDATLVATLAEYTGDPPPLSR